MNKLIYSCWFVLAAQSGYAVSFIHQHVPLAMQKKAAEVQEHFSGIWSGHCFDEDITLNIKEANENISLTWTASSQQGSETIFQQFKTNILQSINLGTTNGSSVDANYAAMGGQLLHVTHFKMYYEGAQSGTSYMSVLFVKKDNILEVIDTIGNQEEQCLLAKTD